MGSKRGQKAKKRAKREARRQTRRAQRGTEASSTQHAPSIHGLTTAPTPQPSVTCSQPNATMIAPVYILQTTEDCWDCYMETPVFALAAEGIERQTPSFSKLEGFLLMTSIAWLSPDLQRLLKEHSNSGFFLDDSLDDSDGGCRYYMNHCSRCGAPIDGYDLYESGAFCPMDEDELECMTVTRLPEGIDLRISAEPGFGMSEWQSFLRRP
jgi:hypothetical protein